MYDIRQLAEHHNNLITSFLEYSRMPGYENYLNDVSRDIEEIRTNLAQVADFRCDNAGYIVDVIPLNNTPQYNHNKPRTGYGQPNRGQSGYFNRDNSGYMTRNQGYNKPETRPNNNEDSRYGKISSKVDMTPRQQTYQPTTPEVKEEKIFVPTSKYPYLVTSDKKCIEDCIGNNVYQYIIDNNNGKTSDMIPNITVGSIDEDVHLDVAYARAEESNIPQVLTLGCRNEKNFIDFDDFEMITDVEDLDKLDLTLLHKNKGLQSYRFFQNYYTRLFNVLAKMKIAKRNISSDDILEDLADINIDLIKGNALPDATSSISKIKDILVKSMYKSSIFQESVFPLIILPVVLIPTEMNDVLSERLVDQEYKSEIYKISELSSADIYSILSSDKVGKLMDEHGYICLTYKHVDGLYRYRIISTSSMDSDYFTTRNSYYL